MKCFPWLGWNRLVLAGVVFEGVETIFGFHTLFYRPYFNNLSARREAPGAGLFRACTNPLLLV